MENLIKKIKGQSQENFFFKTNRTFDENFVKIVRKINQILLEIWENILDYKKLFKILKNIWGKLAGNLSKS